MLPRKLLHSLSGLERGSSKFRIALVLSENSSWTQRKSYLCKPSRYFSSGTLNHQHNKKLVSKKLVPAREYDSDLVVVLDLDECLIHSQFVQGHAGANYAHQVFRSDHDQSPDEKSSSGNFFKISLPDGELVRVHERPYLQEFLQNVSEKYETHIFTASMEVYARPILNALDPHGTIFSSCRFRESCTVDSDMKAYVKNLEFAWGGDQLKRTVLVDNNPLSFMDNPENGILVSNFYNDPNDTTLLTVLDLLEDLESEQDVRPLLDARFGLKQFLKGLRRHQRSRQRRQQEREQGIVAASG